MLKHGFIAAAFACALSSSQAATKADDAARPADATANKPSESGAQTTTPKGAVTGAGQPQGGAQPDVSQSTPTAKTKAKRSGKRATRAKKKRAAPS